MLRMARWSCEDDCRYLCMHEAESARFSQKGKDVSEGSIARHSTWKYYGEVHKVEKGGIVKYQTITMTQAFVIEFLD